VSAGQDHPPTAESLVVDSLDGVAPLFADAIMAALAECNAQGYDAISYETLRSDELQQMYYARGRTVVPPSYTVTNVRSAQYGWHFFGLGDDIISASMRWDVTQEWRDAVNVIMRSHGLSCGADWPSFPDLPHVQWGGCRRSPSNEARALYAQGGLEAVWNAVGASL
jgi:hypothetical protein